ncbi:unnamed protein product [Hydatigera taeniaeformis]|uniref:SRCR domain-containing protein n=1 Tax=Hydatigena taeniaeformis TaxID=6205 RepID=A0A0R3WR15_HYDTA|nr:unnamed protein product [Hydatigera taeniaeformis]
MDDQRGCDEASRSHGDAAEVEDCGLRSCHLTPTALVGEGERICFSRGDRSRRGYANRLGGENWTSWLSDACQVQSRKGMKDGGSDLNDRAVTAHVVRVGLIYEAVGNSVITGGDSDDWKVVNFCYGDSVAPIDTHHNSNACVLVSDNEEHHYYD